MKYQISLLLFLSIFVHTGCSQEDTRSVVGNSSPAAAATATPKAEDDTEKIDIANTKGLIILSYSAVKKGEVHIYNADGSLWYTYRFTDDSDHNLAENADFKPYIYSREGYLELYLIGEKGDMYEVIVNNATGEKKFIKKDDPSFKKQSWEEHVLSMFAVDFDQKTNPLRSSPENGQIIKQSGDRVNYHPKEIKGNWLKVEWFENDDRNKPSHTGWIKWRDNDHIILTLFGKA